MCGGDRQILDRVPQAITPKLSNLMLILIAANEGETNPEVTKAIWNVLDILITLYDIRGNNQENTDTCEKLERLERQHWKFVWLKFQNPQMRNINPHKNSSTTLVTAIYLMFVATLRAKIFVDMEPYLQLEKDKCPNNSNK
uniref:Uncharacterized protein n=1 Tax=Glossina pallidipes TaxID=7398 RepID=A0A1A9Z637_GLOPL